MLKFVDYQVVFKEIPDEITLAINISNCPCHCEGCHSSYLAQDIGKELTNEELRNIIENNNGISCIAFMGGDSSPLEITKLMQYIKCHFNLKTAWYSGREKIDIDILNNLQNFDFIKIGPYKQEFGPLNNPNTNQKFYQVKNNQLIDITYKF